MQASIRALVASLIVALMVTAPSAGASAHPRKHVRLPADYAAWSRVARCESGGLRVLGSSYPDPVGLTAQNYRQFGGHPLPRGPVSVRQFLVVIRVADRFVRHYKIPIPDQDGACRSW